MRFVLSFIFLMTSSLSFAAHKIPAFTGPDFTGVYQCTGLDMHEGEYKGKVTLKLKKEEIGLFLIFCDLYIPRTVVSNI